MKKEKDFYKNNTICRFSTGGLSYDEKQKIDDEKRKRKRLCKKCNYLVYIPYDKESQICKYCGQRIFIDDKAKFKHILNDKIKGKKVS